MSARFTENIRSYLALLVDGLLIPCEGHLIAVVNTFVS
jgi:hypothetical protein